jgi:hypothetical protein
MLRFRFPKVPLTINQMRECFKDMRQVNVAEFLEIFGGKAIRPKTAAPGSKALQSGAVRRF